MHLSGAAIRAKYDEVGSLPFFHWLFSLYLPTTSKLWPDNLEPDQD